MKSVAAPLTHQILFTENGFTAEICIEQKSLELAYQLRYKAYLKAGAIEPDPKEQFTDSYDQQTNSRTYLIWFKGRPVASIRSLTWSEDYNWQPTPSVGFFESDVAQHLGLKTPIVESNRFVVDPGFSGRQSLQAKMLLFRVTTLAALTDQCLHVIIAVRPRHANFYQRIMNFQIISRPISVADVSFEIQLLTTPIISRKKLALNSRTAAVKVADLDRYMDCLQGLKNQATTR